MSVKDALTASKEIASGMMAMNLAPETDGEGKKWRMVGIQSKNRKEWALTHWAGFHYGATTIALYDTLG